MTVTVDTLEKLERRMTLALPLEVINQEVSERLKKLARTVKVDGFRPGKVPMSIVSQRYAYSVHHEVLNDKASEAFFKAAEEAKLKVAGRPTLTEKDGVSEGQFNFDATFEVYPEITYGDLALLEVERVSSEVTEAAVDKTIDVLRKQRRTFSQKAAIEGAEEGDRVTIDFEGKIDGVLFEGGKAQGFQFLIGEGQMLPAFDKAVRGMKLGDSKTFPLEFPQDYHSTELAGKEADFMVTMKKIEGQNLPEVNDEFAVVLGIKVGTVETLRAEVRVNLGRAVEQRIVGLNKVRVLDALREMAQFDVPKALVAEEAQRMVDNSIEDLKRRGFKEVDTGFVKPEMFTEVAEKRVRVGLIVIDMVRQHKLQSTPDQIRAYLEGVASNYENPAEVMHAYLTDRQRMVEVDSLVVERNVVDFVLSKAKVTDKVLPFDELMEAQ